MQILALVAVIMILKLEISRKFISSHFRTPLAKDLEFNECVLGFNKKIVGEQIFVVFVSPEERMRLGRIH